MKKLMLRCVCPLLLTGIAYARSGSVDIHFSNVYAVSFAGEPDFNADDNSYCRKNIGSQFLQKPMSVSYTIEPKSTYQTSQVNYLSEQVPLYPEGLTDRYSFMSDGVGTLGQNNIFRVIASFDKALQIASSFVLFKTDHGFNCVMVGVGPVS